MMKNTTSLISALVFVILTISLSEVFSKDSEWRGWRGPNGDFKVQTDQVLTGDAPVSLEIIWKKPLGSGYSPVSIGNDMAVTMFSDSTYDYLIALNINAGEELWRFAIDSTFPGRFGSIDGGISTPLITDEAIVTLHPNGRLVSLNPKSGKLIWETNFVKRHDSKVPLYGMATSPLQYNNMVIAQTGGHNNNAVTAFDLKTGEVRWSSASDSVFYQSPGLYMIDRQQQLICVSGHSIFGFNPDNGKILWQYEHGGDGNYRGALSANMVEVKNNTFFFKDKNRSAGLFEINMDSDSSRFNEIWRTNDIRGTYVVPVYHNGHIFGFSTRIFNAIDAATGKRVWRSRAPGDGFPIVINDHLVVATKDGHLSIAPVSKEGYDEVARLKVFNGLIWSNPSYSNKRLYLRSTEEIACVEIVLQKMLTEIDNPVPGIIPNSEFYKFVKKVESSENKTVIVDEFLKSQKTFPIIEGEHLVHFIYYGEANDIAINGDLQGFRFDSPMHRIEGTNLFYFSDSVEADARLNYGFTKDMSKNINDSLNTTWGSITDNISWFSMPKWQRPQHLIPREDDKNGQLDSLQYTSNIADTTLALPVYLPHGYGNSDQTYPVAYIHFGYRAIAWGNVPTSLDNIIGESVEPVIVVFLPVFIGGWPDYDQYCGSERDTYFQAFTEEIIPLIETTYRVKTTPDARANIGHEFTGFMAIYSTLNKPAFFGKLGIQSFYRDSKDVSMIESLMPDTGSWLTDIYLDWGKYDMRSPNEGAGMDVIGMSKSFTKLLSAKGYTFTGGQVNDGGGWSSYQNRTDKLFEALFPLKPE